MTVCDHEAVLVDAGSGPDAKERLRERRHVPHWLRTHASDVASLEGGTQFIMIKRVQAETAPLASARG